MGREQHSQEGLWDIVCSNRCVTGASIQFSSATQQLVLKIQKLLSAAL